MYTPGKVHGVCIPRLTSDEFSRQMEMLINARTVVTLINMRCHEGLGKLVLEWILGE